MLPAVMLTPDFADFDAAVPFMCGAIDFIALVLTFFGIESKLSILRNRRRK